MDGHRLTPDGVQARQLTGAERAALVHAQAQMYQLRVPRLQNSPHDRVFVAAMDGTGNSLYKDAPENITVVAGMREKVAELRHPAIAVRYIEGVGTQDDRWLRRRDAAFALTFEKRVEQMYLEFCKQAAVWLHEDPAARIHFAGIGFSRGAEGVTALQRMIHERGIRDPLGVDARYDSEDLLSSITWAAHPPLVPPGRTAQVAMLIDPVGTEIYDINRSRPPSSISTLQITTLDERRDHFTATMHASAGLSEAGTAANLFVPGAHSDGGGAYLLDGSGRIVMNMGVDYFNAMFDEAKLEKVPEALDPRMYVAHSSDQHLMGLWPMSAYARDGERLMHTNMAPGCKVTAPVQCQRDPIDHELAASFDWSHVEPGRPPGGSDAKMDLAMASIRTMHARDPGRLEQIAAHSRVPLRAEALAAVHDVGAMFDRLAESATRGDLPGMSMVVRTFVETPAGLPFKPGYAAVRVWSHAHSGQEPESIPGMAIMRAPAPSHP